MLKDCIAIFKEQYKGREREVILSSWVLGDGTYVLINMGDGKKENFQEKIFQILKKENPKDLMEYGLLQKLDYLSRTTSPNKRIATSITGKSVTSNQILSFIISKGEPGAAKKKGLQKLSEEMIDAYYEELLWDNKNLFGEDASLTFLKEQISSWIKENIFRWKEDEDKGVLKLFFVFPEEEKTIRSYEKGERAYLFSERIFNDKKNVVKNSSKKAEFGISLGKDVTLSENKPFLMKRTRNVSSLGIPQLVSQEESLDHMIFYDFLETLYGQGVKNIYFDVINRRVFPIYPGKDWEFDTLSGYFMQIRKVKSTMEMVTSVSYFDSVPRYQRKMKVPFSFEEFFKSPFEENFENKKVSSKKEGKEQDFSYRVFEGRKEMYDLIEDTFFKNFNEKSEKTHITQSCKKKLEIDFLYKGEDLNLLNLIERFAFATTKESVQIGWRKKALQQLNLLYSLKKHYKKEGDEIKMLYKNLLEKMYSDDIWTFSSDQEYYFAFGQVLAYILTQSRAADKGVSLSTPFFCQKDSGELKKRLNILFNRFNHSENLRRKVFKNILGLLMEYIPEGKVNSELILAGYAQKNIFFEKNPNQSLTLEQKEQVEK